MASTASTLLSHSSSAAFINHKVFSRPQPATHCVALPALSVAPAKLHSHAHFARATDYCRKFARNVAVMATGDAPVEVVAPPIETPEIVKTIQEAWDKVEDKYAVTYLGVAAGVALYASAGVISAIDRLPLVPGVLELIGIGYTGWFAYRNLVYKPDREALIKKIKDTYYDVIGSS